MPMPFYLAGSIKSRIILALMLLVAATLVLSPLRAMEPVQGEKLQLRVGALAEDPRVAGQAVGDAWFLTRFYERRQFTPAWDSPAKVAELLKAINESTKHGFAPGDYHRDALAELVAAAPQAPTASAAIELDLLATDSLIRLAFHLRFGKVDPRQLEPSWNFSRDMDGVDPVDFIEALLTADDLATALAAQAPDSDFYRGLAAYLEIYREIGARGGWPEIGAGPTLRLGMATDRIALLRQRLWLTGDLTDDPAMHLVEEQAADPMVDWDDTRREHVAAVAVFDSALEAAVRRFQERHGLAVDGLVGRQTVAELDVPVEHRIAQLRVNMERARWVFRDLEPRLLLVNIARFRVLLIEAGEVTWSTRAVVGRPYRQTPVFKARMTYLEFNPTWTVPPTILRQDLLPDIRRDPEVLQRRNMVVLDAQGRHVDPATIDWVNVTARTFPYMIRQLPGPENALGRVKFMYPNPYHVYMHDTPARDLFERSARSFSSGCIRLEKPFELASRLLAGTEWDDAAIDQALASGRTRVVNLARPITVLTLYGTAVPEAGQIVFAPDIYERDARLLRALDAPLVFSPPGGYEEALR